MSHGPSHCQFVDVTLSFLTLSPPSLIAVCNGFPSLKEAGASGRGPWLTVMIAREGSDAALSDVTLAAGLDITGAVDHHVHWETKQPAQHCELQFRSPQIRI